jgi:hypothetical protein
MRDRRLLALIALALLVPVSGLTLLAYASPPDPSWIRGIYDGADYDDVVLLITSETGTVVSLVLVDRDQGPPPVGSPMQLGDDHAPLCPVSTLSSRAPPAL